MAQTRSFNLNGKSVDVTIDDPDMPLLYALRNNLGLRGPRFGCSNRIRCSALSSRSRLRSAATASTA